MNTKRFLSGPVTASLAAALLCCLPTSNQHAQIIIGSTTATGFSGQAAAVTGFTGGGAVSVADTGGLAASGGAIGAAALETSLAGGLAVGASHTAVVGGGSATAAEASVANVNFASSGGLFGANSVRADFVMSRAASASAAVGATAAGAVQISGLVVNGQAVAVTGAANQTVFLAGGGFVIINEQLAGVGGITVNALHIVDTVAAANVVIGSCTAGVNYGILPVTPTTAPPCDFLTGGGWTVGTPSGAKANFGVAGGIKNGAFWGHLNYIDHGNGMHVKATAVTGYTVDPADAACRIICYDVTVDGVPGFKARVRACDYGEPGRNDIFEIKVYNTPPPPPCGTGPDTPIYSAGGDLGGSNPGGGNIQLHKCQ